MLRRLKTINPKYKALAGIWLALEILSIPAAAAVVASGWTIQPDVIAERVNAGQDGTAIYVVTHTTAFNVAVKEGSGIVTVDVQGTSDPLNRALRTSRCAKLDTSHIRIVETVDAPAEDYGTIIVTVTYDAGMSPDISFEREVFAPEAPDCSDASA